MFTNSMHFGINWTINMGFNSEFHTKPHYKPIYLGMWQYPCALTSRIIMAV